MEDILCAQCGKPITRPDRRIFCSPDCAYTYKLTHSHTSDFKPVEAICPWCKKKFIRETDARHYCSKECAYEYNKVKNKIRGKIKNIARIYGFDLKNVDKIVKAKIMLFKDGNVHRCPCDADNPSRFCGSAVCLHDVKVNRHCECRLFWKVDK